MQSERNVWNLPGNWDRRRQWHWSFCACSVVTGFGDNEDDGNTGFWSLCFIYICSFLLLMLSRDGEDDGDEGVMCWLNWRSFLYVFLFSTVLFPLVFSALSLLFFLAPLFSVFFSFFSPLLLLFSLFFWSWPFSGFYKAGECPAVVTVNLVTTYRGIVAVKCAS